MLSNKALSASSFFQPTEGGITLANSGTYSLVIPPGITSIAGIAIGAGGGGGGVSSAATASGAGGGGGALSYSNTISVTPGETLTVQVGNGGSAGGSSGTSGGVGGDSFIRRSSTNLLLAKGGGGGSGNTGSSTSGAGAGGAAASGVGDVKYSGGAGGARNSNDRGGGGGGAAGYSGNGGTGGQGTTNPTAGAGGGGGGGFTGTDGSTLVNQDGGWGGGVQFYGSGSNGAAGVVGADEAARTGGLGSSKGSTASGVANSRRPGGGGGGASSTGVSNQGRAGEPGAVRILWGGSKSFPSTGVTSNTVSLFASVSSNTSTITVPSNVQPGDLMVLLDIGFGSSTPTLVTPSGFTSITSSSDLNGRINSSYKQVLSAADSETTLTGIDGNVSNNKILLVFRGTSGYSFLKIDNFTPPSEEISSEAMGLTGIGNSSVDSYAGGISVTIGAFYGSNGITPATDITFSGATFVQGASSVFYAGYRIYTQASTDVFLNVSMSDKGTNGWALFQVRGY